MNDTADSDKWYSKAVAFFLWLVANSKYVGGRVGGEDAEWVGITSERGGMKNVED